MMAKRFPHHGLLALCSLALPAAAVAQDASIGTGQDDSDQTQGDSGFGNMGSMTTETTTTGSSHSQARSHGSDVEVDIGRPDNRGDDWGHDRHRGGPPINDSDLFGDWTLGEENGSSCTITLKDSQWFGGYGAWVPAGCPDGFFSVNRWLLSGNQLLLSDTNHQVIGRFRPSGGGRWSGRREPDGTRIYLNPRQR